MIRCDDYTEHNGREYRLVVNRFKKDKQYSLVSNLLREELKEDEMHNAVSELLRQGFHHYGEDTYVKYINKEDIKEVYHITTRVKYQGHEFGAWMDKDNQICFVTCDWKLAQELGFEPFLDQCSWVKWVDKDEVEIYEVRKIVER